MDTATILSRIEAHCRATGMSETAFGVRAINDAHLVREMRAGRSITLRTLARLEEVFATAASAPSNPGSAMGRDAPPSLGVSSL